FELGGDSILSIQVVSAARRAGLTLTSKEVFRHQTVRTLAAAIESAPADIVAAPDTDPEADRRGQVPLTPVQRWFFATNTVAPHHYTMSVLLDLAHDVDVQALRSAVEAVVAGHDALAMRYQRDADGWHQTWSGERSPAFDVVDLVGADDQDAAVDATASMAQ